MAEPRTIMAVYLAQTVEQAKAIVPPVKQGWKRVNESMDEFSELACYRVRIQIIDKEIN